MACIAVGGAIVAVMVWRAVPQKVHVPPLNLQRWIEVARSPALRLLTLTTALNATGNHVVFSYLAPTMKQLHDVTGSVLASLYFVNGLGGIAGSFLAVAMVSRWGAHQVAFRSILLVIVVIFGSGLLLGTGSLLCLYFSFFGARGLQDFHRSNRLV